MNFEPYRIGRTCHHEFTCENHKPASKYQVIFKHGAFNLSTVVRADSVGQAVLRASRLLSHTNISLDEVTYDRCVPVAA